MLPGYKSEFIQQRLFDTPIKNGNSVRNICGELAERLTGKLTGARRMKTDSRIKMCPDLHFADNLFLESKSVGCSNKIIIYQHRYEKDRKFIEAGNELVYVVWHHKARVLGETMYNEVVEQYFEKLLSVTLIDHASISQVLDCGQKEIKVVNSCYYSNRGQVHRGVGWCIPLKMFFNDHISFVTVHENTIPILSTFGDAEKLIKTKQIQLTI